MNAPVIVSRSEWLAARRQLLDEEKELTRARDALSVRRRDLPWVRVEKTYVFEGESGKVSLADLFGSRQQLLIYHFMFGPDWEAGCKSCSFWADNFNGILPHLAQRDVSMVAVSRAPWVMLQRYQQRLGWTFPWVSSRESDFNIDYAVSFDAPVLAQSETRYNFGLLPPAQSEMPGVSVFIRDESGCVFHTYSAYSRGIDALNGAYQYLDLVPKGRDEAGLPYAMAWVKRRDEYAP